MEVQEYRQGAVTVLRPTGALVQEDADAFLRNIEGVIAKTLGRFVIDISAVPYVDSAGLEVLLDINDRLRSGGQALKLCAVNETIREVLELTDIRTEFEHFDDVNSAVRSFL